MRTLSVHSMLLAVSLLSGAPVHADKASLKKNIAAIDTVMVDMREGIPPRATKAAESVFSSLVVGLSGGVTQSY